jgi:hypothetical protein
VLESKDFGFGIADFGLEHLQPEKIHNKIPQSAISIPQSNTPAICVPRRSRKAKTGHLLAAAKSRFSGTKTGHLTSDIYLVNPGICHLISG